MRSILIYKVSPEDAAAGDIPIRLALKVGELHPEASTQKSNTRPSLSPISIEKIKDRYIYITENFTHSHT